MSFSKPVSCNNDKTPSNAAVQLDYNKIVQLARCSICLESYTANTRAPMCLPCGHTFCSVCVRRITCGHLVCCCICRKVALFGPHGLGKNIQLLNILETLSLLVPDSNDHVNHESLSNFPENTMEEIDDRELFKFFDFCFLFVQKYFESKHEVLLEELARASGEEEENENDMMNKAVNANKLLSASKLLGHELDKALVCFNECIQISRSQVENATFVEGHVALMEDESDPFGIESVVRLNHD